MSTLVPVRRETRNLWDSAANLERVFDVMSQFDPGLLVREEGLWHPTMDIYDRKDEMVVELEIPGMKAEDVDITVEEDHLIVEGTLKRSQEFTEEEKYYSERDFGKFHRVIHLPTSVDHINARARFDNGVLSIRLPKKARESGNKIRLEAA